MTEIKQVLEQPAPAKQPVIVFGFVLAWFHGCCDQMPVRWLHTLSLQPQITKLPSPPRQSAPKLNVVVVVTLHVCTPQALYTVMVG